MQKISLDKNWQYLKSDLLNKLMLNVLGGWQKTDLPHDYSPEMERSKDAKGGLNDGFMRTAGLYYKKEFIVEEAAAGKRFWLEFESIAGISSVWFNGTFITKHLNPYTGILAEVTEHVKPGLNEIIIYTDNSNKPNSRWYTGCGLTGHVWMHVGGQVTVRPWTLHVTTTRITGIEQNNAALAVKCFVDNSLKEARKINLTVTLRDADNREIAKQTTDCLVPPGGTQSAVELEAQGISPWSRESPTLYSVSVSVDAGDGAEEIASCRTGIRTIHVDPKNGLRLNGNTIKMKGGCIHHDLGVLGAAAFDAAIKRKIQILLDNGYTALRLAHNPYPPAFFEICDELGMLVVEEAFDEWVLGRTSFGHYTVFESEWEKDLEAMINRDYNHPSIIMWSTGNEVEERDGSADGFAWSRKLAEKVRSLDTSRPVAVSACALPAEYGQRPPEGTTGNQGLNMSFDNFESGVDLWGDTTAPFFEPVDVAGYNYKTMRYAHDGRKFPKRVIYGSETYPIQMYDNWQNTLANDHVIGDFVWTAWDYLGESGGGRYAVGDMRIPPGPEWPWLTANQADIDLTGNKRPQSYYRDVVWQRHTEPRLFVLPPQLTGKPISRMSWTWLPVERNYTYPGNEGQAIEVHVYAYADEVELFQNGVSKGRKALNHENQYIAVFTAQYEVGVLEVTAFKDGKECGRDTLATTGPAVQLSLKASRNTINADSADLCFVEIAALDKNGESVYTEDGAVTVELQGGGTLIALGTADPMPDSALPFRGNSMPLYHGRALAVIRGEEGAKGCTLTAKLENGVQAETAIGFTPVTPPDESLIHEIKPGPLDSPLSVLLADEKAASLLRAELPDLMNNPMLVHIKSMSLRKLAGMGGDMIPAGVLKSLEQKLKGL
jgi:beta-galactosidase